MKKNTHPSYQDVLFIDSASGYRFVCGSTLKTDATEVFNDVEYPVSYLSISSASHPFFTGSKQLVDSEGRVDRFKKRFGTRASVPVRENLSGETEGSEPSQEQQVQSIKKEASKPQGKPAAKSSAKPAAKSAEKSSAKPAAKPAAKKR